MSLFALDVKRLRASSFLAAKRKLLKSLLKEPTRRLKISPRLEALEVRNLLAAVPVALDDNSYFTSSGTDLVVTTSSNPGPLTTNDVDIDSTTKNASVVVNPSSGSLIAFNANGTFTYRPNSGFVGVDSFTYKVNDGTLDSNTATVRIAVGTRLVAKQNLDSNVLIGSSGGIVRDPTTGGLELTEQLTPDQSLVYRSDALTRPIIVVETKLAPGVAVPSSITAQLTFNSVAGSSYSYSTTGMTSGQSMRFAIQADGSSLATGMYDYSMKVTTTVSGVSTDQFFTGKQAIVNRSSSEFGANWWLDGLDRLVDSSAGALLVAGNGDTLWFAKSGSTYLSAAGDQLNQALVKNVNNTFTLTSKFGDKKNFSTTGLLTSLVDSNNNTISFAYADRNSDGIANELISITDPFGRVTQFNYTSGKVSSIAHFSGRTTTLSISGNDLTGYTLTDPDGAGPLSAPSIGFAYSSQGVISSKTDAVSNATSFSFDTTDGRLRSMTSPGSAVWQVTPIETIGLPTGPSSNTLRQPSEAQASITDERNNVWKLRSDRFGQVTEFTTALGFVTSVLRDSNGLPYSITTPDPDGTSGSKTAATQLVGYDAAKNTTHIIAADGGVTTASYSSLARLLSTTDQVSRTTSYTYDSNGNRLTEVDPAGFTTSYAYNSIGLPTSITQPDPDGAGALTSPVTSLAYDSYGKLTTLTNPDSSTQTFTYNSADQMLTSVDELGKTTTLVYDSLGRQTSVTNRVSATTQFAYDALSRVISQTDALGNVTDIEYNNRGWVNKVTYPDPDGAGSLSRPVDQRIYDAVGNQTSAGAPSSTFSTSATATFDADNRKISETDPADVSKSVYWDYDNTGRMIAIYRVAASKGQSGGKTIVDYDAVGRVTRQRTENIPTYGSATIQQDQSVAYNTAGEVISQTDGRGYVTSFTYNSRGLLATETLPDADGSGSQWGLLVSYSYDNMGRLTSVNRGFSRVTTLEYNNRSWLTKMTRPDPDGAGSLSAPVIQFGYNSRGDRTTVTDALGGVTTTAFDNEQRPTSITYPDPDGSGPLTSPAESTAYDLLNRITSKTNALGGVTSFTYDALSRQLTQTDPDPDGSGPLTSAVTTMTYSASGLSQVTDALSRVISYGRDGQGRVTSLTDGSGNVTNFTYDYYSNLLSKTEPDPDGSGPLSRPVTTFSYDLANRQISKTDPLGGVTNYTYDKANNLTSLTDPNNNTTNFGYDGMNRLILNTNSLNKSQNYTYDVAGNVVRSTDRNGKVIEYDFDALDRSTAERWQSSSTTPTLTIATTQDGGNANEQQSVGWTGSGMSISGTYTLTQNGQTTSAIAWNASAATIQSALEALSTIGTGNVLVTVTAPNSYSRTIQLNFRNGKAGVNMAQTTIDVTGISIYMGGKTPFANTDVQGGAYSEVQTINLSNASSGQWRVAFNGEVSNALSVSISAADLKTALDNFAGIDNVTVTGSSGSFTVTFGGSQTGVNVSQLFGDASSASCGSTVQTITSSFNANDQLTSMSDPNATINYTLDSLGRATAISNSISGLTPTVTLNQAFNAAGLRTELKATVGSTLDFKNSYQFDTLGRMTELIQQGQSGGNAVTAKRATFAYNVLNQRTLVSRYQSTGTTNAVATTEYSYDTLNRLSGLTHKQGSTVLSGYTYTYDGLSRLASVTSTIEGLSSYSYDATSQVVGADHASGGQADESYSFDANGNRNSMDYTVDTNNHITADANFTYAYDDQGNRTSRTDSNTGKVTEYSWDHRNRLVTVKDRASSGGSVVKQVDYAYDAFNRLVKRTYDADGAGSGTATTQYWVYDEGINAVMQFEGSSSSNLSHRYLWTDVVDELMADEIVGSGADTQYALGDHLGTIRDIANFNESTSITSVTNHRTYSSFGQLTAETNSAIDLIFGYTGKQLDDATGLQHNLFRWYDSALGQWMSEDPLGFAAGDENLKRYVGNSGTTLSDSTGLYASEAQLNLTSPSMVWVSTMIAQQEQPPKEGLDLAKDLAKKMAEKFKDKIMEGRFMQERLQAMRRYRAWWSDKIHFPWEADKTNTLGPGPWHPQILKIEEPWWKRTKFRFQYQPKDWLSPLDPKHFGVTITSEF